MRRKSIILAALVGLVAFPAGSYAGGNHGSRSVGPSCVVDGNIVTATQLPTDQVINFMVTDAGGTTGWVLGFTDIGVLSVTVPWPNGPTTYQFVSRTWGPGGSKYNVFSSCSA
jgi:hypothetical protein